MMNHYDGLSVVAEKKKPSGGSWAWDKIYTVAQGVISHIISESTWSGTAWQTKYYHFDAIGSVAAHTNTSGSMIALFDQGAYGNVKQIYGTGSESGYHLTTKEFDTSPELYYFFQRWYEPGDGFFLSKSKFRIDIEHHYIYVANNPLKWTDPYGSRPVDDAWKKWLNEFCHKCGPLSNILITVGLRGDNLGCGDCSEQACKALTEAVPGSSCDVVCSYAEAVESGYPVIPTHCVSYLNFPDGHSERFDSWDYCPGEGFPPDTPLPVPLPPPPKPNI